MSKDTKPWIVLILSAAVAIIICAVILSGTAISFSLGGPG